MRYEYLDLNIFGNVLGFDFLTEFTFKIMLLFYKYYIKLERLMSNPFEFFAQDDDEETYQQTATNESKVKRTHQQKRIFKQQQATKGPEVSSPVVTEPLPERRKENIKEIKNNRAPPTPATKKLGQGHYLDRRSGTGRIDRPRKEGGGYRNIGNAKDELNENKYIKETPEQTPAQTEAPTEPVVEEPPKPQEPEKLTLEEYYKNKGIELNNNFDRKAPVKKAEINADWIKKEKLVVLETKQEKKNNERNAQGAVKFSDSRSGIEENLQVLGFGQRAPKRVEQKREARQQNHRGGKGQKAKVVIHEQDFPTL